MIREVQVAAAAALLADAAVVALVGADSAGPAVRAGSQELPPNLFPRIMLQTPQRIDASTSCSVGADIILTVHSLAAGSDCTLKAGELADAAVAALSQALDLGVGLRVSAWAFITSRPVGDPRADVEKVVSTLRYSVQPTG